MRGFHCFLVWAEPEGLETGVGPRHPGSGGVGGGGLGLVGDKMLQQALRRENQRCVKSKRHEKY